MLTEELKWYIPEQVKWPVAKYERHTNTDIMQTNQR